MRGGIATVVVLCWTFFFDHRNELTTAEGFPLEQRDVLHPFRTRGRRSVLLPSLVLLKQQLLIGVLWDHSGAQMLEAIIEPAAFFRATKAPDLVVDTDAFESLRDAKLYCSLRLILHP